MENVRPRSRCPSLTVIFHKKLIGRSRNSREVKGSPVHAIMRSQADFGAVICAGASKDYQSLPSPLVPRRAYSSEVVAFKMDRRSGLGRTVRAGLAVRGRISKSIRNRRATRPPAPFQRNPLGRVQLAVFPRCSLLTYRSRYARRSRLEKQPTDLRRNQRDLGDGALAVE